MAGLSNLFSFLVTKSSQNCAPNGHQAAGSLDGRKARLFLSLLLRSGKTDEEVREAFAAWLDHPVAR